MCLKTLKAHYLVKPYTFVNLTYRTQYSIKPKKRNKSSHTCAVVQIITTLFQQIKIKVKANESNQLPEFSGFAVL